jgi:hypothetical protein
MAGVFGFPDWCRRGVTVSLRAGSVVDSMPLEYLYDAQPGLRARLVPAAGVVSIVFDFGVAQPQGLVILVNSTASGAETVRVRLSSADSTGAAGDVSNTLHSTVGAARTRGAAVCLLPADLSARYLRVDVADIAGDIFDLGSVLSMPTLRLQRQQDYGWREGRFYTGTTDANPFTGAEFRTDGLASLRQWDFALPTIFADEFAGTLRALLDDVRPSDDVAWIPDDGLTQAELNRRSIVGGLVRPGEEFGLTRVSLRTARAQFTIRERA